MGQQRKSISPLEMPNLKSRNSPRRAIIKHDVRRPSRRVKIGDLLLRCLEEAGVRHLFGVSGDGACSLSHQIVALCFDLITDLPKSVVATAQATNRVFGRFRLPKHLRYQTQTPKS